MKSNPKADADVVLCRRDLDSSFSMESGPVLPRIMLVTGTSGEIAAKLV